MQLYLKDFPFLYTLFFSLNYKITQNKSLTYKSIFENIHAQFTIFNIEMAKSHFSPLLFSSTFVHLKWNIHELAIKCRWSWSTFKNNEIFKGMGSIFSGFVPVYEVQFRARAFCQSNFDVRLILISSDRRGKVSMPRACEMRVLRFSARIAIPFCFPRKTRSRRWTACAAHFRDIHSGSLRVSEIWTKQGSHMQCRK